MNANQLVEKFIYSCSHDLRSPITSIQGLVRIAGYYPHHSETHKCLEMIEACAQQMDNLISGLQQYLTSSLSEIEAEPMDPTPIVTAVMTEFKSKADNAGIKLVNELESGVAWRMDSNRLYHILKQLIANSIAFHNPGNKDRKIMVKGHSDKDNSTLEVWDNGIGISLPEQARIFEAFHRGTEKTIGIGMGLFLVKNLIEQMGGRIICTSSPGEWTSMILSFPTELPAFQKGYTYEK